MTADDLRRIALALPIQGGWGRMGMTPIRLAEADEPVLTGALQTALKLRADNNAKTGKRKTGKRKTRP